VLAVLALAVALAGPPAAFVDTGSTHVPLAVSSWCQAGRCGAPTAAARHVATVRRGQLVRCVLGFAPARVRVSVGGAAVPVATHGAIVEWHAARSGGVTLTAASPRLWVTYVGRLAVHG
jgi:hypothetical protein